VEPIGKAFSHKKGLGNTLEDVSVKLANRYYTQFGTGFNTFLLYFLFGIWCFTSSDLDYVGTYPFYSLGINLATQPHQFLLVVQTSCLT